MKPLIKFHKWSKKESNQLFHSIRKTMGIIEPQLYYPIMSMFFYIHNTSNSHKLIDFERANYITEILDTFTVKDYNSNIRIRARTNNSDNMNLFGKIIPLLDPIHYLLNNYNIISHHNPLLPSNYSFNPYSKINDMNNMAYLDIFFSYIVSEISHHDKNPSFPIYYGSFNGLGNYKYDITDDIDELRNHKGFLQVAKNHISLEGYQVIDSESDSDSDNSLDEDVIATFTKFPVACLVIEELEGTLEDIIKNQLSIPLLISCLFQVSFALLYLQKHYHFTHNDLHINNIMYKETTKKYIYYKFNNQYFKVPTYGKMFKIIDFGRSVFTFRQKTYMNDVFSKYGEAEGQYTHPPQVSFLKTDYTDIVYPSYHFDLCRLAITMIDEIRYNHDDELEDNEQYQLFLDFLKYMATDKYGTRLDKEEDNFDLYIKISNNADKCLPKDVIISDIFKWMRVKKNEFPKSTYYSL